MVVERNGRYIVYDKQGKVVIITRESNIAKHYEDKINGTHSS